MRWPSFNLFELAIFSLMTLAFSFQLARCIHRLRRNDKQILQQRVERWGRRPKWLISGIMFFVLGVGFVFLGAMTAVKTYRWQQDRKTAEHQKALPLDLHIPSVSPDRTYTVVAKFRVRGRSYTSLPLQMKFGRQKSSYPVTLYYDVKDPAKNSWTRFETPDQRELKQALGHAIGLIFIGILLIDYGEIQMIKRRLAGNKSL
jgi:hypothetical protein